MKLLITLTLALAPLRAHAYGRLARYARNSTSPGRCDRNVFERQFYDLAKGLEPTSGFEHKIPDDVSFVYCQLEACVIGKRNRHVEGSRPGLPGHDFPGRR